ncbi:MAG: pentapeptide repeat-containing protein [Oscillospiraceae bacterium]|nr:pentapeptide repeat-containing protein [Oscillospiraceae bacterium]
MANYQKVKSGLEISMGIAGYLQLANPKQYNGWSRAKIIREANDIIQGRSSRTVDELLDEVKEKGRGWYPHEIERFSREIAALQEQKKLVTIPYAKEGAGGHTLKSYKGVNGPLKVIDQQLYDEAVAEGFPSDFFRKSYFDRVIFYCLPDDTDFTLSEFRNCTFAVCRLKGACFDDTRIYDCDFYSCFIRNATFSSATVAHTHFRDSFFRTVSFQRANLKHTYVADCIMEHGNFRDATLDGCAFGRITAKGTKNLNTAFITFSGCRADEVEKERRAIYKALCSPVKKARKPGKGGQVR